jgi:hypothetical protein
LVQMRTNRIHSDLPFTRRRGASRHGVVRSVVMGRDSTAKAYNWCAASNRVYPEFTENKDQAELAKSRFGG